MTNFNGVVVVGNGCAAVECVQALRNNGFAGDIDVFADTNLPVANPMLTTYYAAGKIAYEQLFPYGTDNGFFARNAANVHANSPVEYLDAEKKLVTTKNGLTKSFDRCLIASGASPFMPPIPGIDSSKVYGIRTVNDALYLKKAVEKKPAKVIVAGASMAGVKVMELFHKAGAQVLLADMAKGIFPLAAHPDCARFIEDRLTAKGIRLKFDAPLERIEDTPYGLNVSFQNSAPESADILVMCIGVRANLGFVSRTQLDVKQGLLVDDYMRSNVPWIYAAGDVAQGRNIQSGEQQVIGLWANARLQGRTAGANMAGGSIRYPGNIPHNITHFMGMDFIGIGNVRRYDRTTQKLAGEKYVQLFWEDGLLVGANMVNVFTKSGVLKNFLIKELLQIRMPSSVESVPKLSSPSVESEFIQRLIEEVELQ